RGGCAGRCAGARDRRTRHSPRSCRGESAAEYISAAAPPNHRWTHTDSTGCCCPVEIRDWCLAPRGGMANDPRLKDGPLDGSTSGTIGGGGPETGGPGERATVPDVPRSKPEDAASGPLTPDAIDAATPVDDLKSPPSDVSRR